ncbi:hypothetical protein TNCV_5003201 [Trichonephila clavipes]|nr:hypothetical protein TNCV_5003201 [Trichonephila clavipes]
MVKPSPQMRSQKPLDQFSLAKTKNFMSVELPDRVTGVNSSDSSSSLSILLWFKATISASDRAHTMQQCPCQPTRSRQTSNLVLGRSSQRDGSALNSVSVSSHQPDRRGET